MKTNCLKSLILAIIMAFSLSVSTSSQLPNDTFETSEGPLKIFHVGHASLYFTFNGKVIHVDPFGEMGEYPRMPKADLVLITHAHGDHLDPGLISIRLLKSVQLFVQ